MAHTSFNDAPFTRESELYLAASLYRDGQYDEAERLLDELIAKARPEADPDRQLTLPCSQYFLALVKHTGGRDNEARRLLQDAGQSRRKVILSRCDWKRQVVLNALRAEVLATIENHATRPHGDMTTR